MVFDNLPSIPSLEKEGMSVAHDFVRLKNIKPCTSLLFEEGQGRCPELVEGED